MKELEHFLGMNFDRSYTLNVALETELKHFAEMVRETQFKLMNLESSLRGVNF